MSWETVQLSTVAEIIAGQSPESKFYNDKGEGIPFFQGKADFRDDYPIVRYWCTQPTKIAKPMDILMSVRAPVGPTNICDIEACIGRGLAAIRTGEKLDYKYLYFYFKTIEAKLASQGNGSTFSAITASVIKEIQIPLPPLHIQKKIAQILDTADALKRKDQQLFKKYDELAQAIFIDMFGDPVKNEKGWEKLPFGELFDSRLGKMLDVKKQLGNARYRYLGNSNVQWFRFQLENLAEMEFDEKELRTFDLRNGDILICEGGEVGRSAIWKNETENIYFQKAIHRARAKTENITAEYTVMLFWFFAKFGGLKDFVTTSTISHLTSEKLKTILIPVPPISIQIKYEKVISSLKKQIDIDVFNLSNNLFQTLIQKAFNNELVTE